jgi:hypothetical protein
MVRQPGRQRGRALLSAPCFIFDLQGSYRPSGIGRCLAALSPPQNRAGRFPGTRLPGWPKGSDLLAGWGWHPRRLRLQPHGASNLRRTLTRVHRSLGPCPCPTSAPFRVGQRPIQPVSRCLSAAGVRFLGHLFPAAGLGLPCGRLTGRARRRRGYHVPHQGETMGVSALFTPGSGCPHRDFCVSLVPSDPVLPSWSTIVRQPYMTKPHREFIRIHPSHLSLGRFVRMARTPLGLYPWLRTPPLPVTHAGIGNRHGHLPGSHDHSPGAASCRTQKL